MAEAVFNRLAAGRGVAESAGTVPGEGAQPSVVEVMREMDIDVSAHRSRMITDEQVARADRIITMGCSVEGCPVTFLPAEDWGLPDPKGQPIEAVRAVRDVVIGKVRDLLAEMGIPADDAALGSGAR